MSVYAKLSQVQTALKAPKGQYNGFGKYKYRSCEDILEAVKPLLANVGLVLTLTDDLVNICGRFYVKATATVTDILDEKQISVNAFAREEESKKGMDGSQVTGASSSYARKYALNGLFNIDDTKDSDVTSTQTKDDPDPAGQQSPTPAMPPQMQDEYAGLDPETAEKMRKAKLRRMLLARLDELGMNQAEYGKAKGLSKETEAYRYEKLLRELGVNV